MRTPPADLPQFSAPDVVVNVGQSGYFRTLYTPPLIDSLSTRFASLAPIDQLGMLQDTAALGMAGYEPLPDFLRLARQVSSAMQPQVQRAVVTNLSDIARLYRDRPGEATFRAFARPLLARLLSGTGWSPAIGESANIKSLRPALIKALSDLDDKDVVDRARQLFMVYRRDPGSLQTDLREAVLRVVATHADAALWQQLHTLGKTAHGAVEKAQYYELLGFALDPVLARQALDLTLTTQIEPTTRPVVINAVARTISSARL